MIHIYFEGDKFYNQLKKDIINAEYYIFFEFYIFQLKIIGNQLLDLLIQKNIKDKISVRIFVDGIGSREYIEEIQKKIQNTTIELAVYKPFHFKILLKQGYHRRNHRKLILIDDKILYTGGMNIKDVFSEKIYGPERWRDTMLRIEGKDNIEIKRIFFQSKYDFMGLWRITKKGFYFLPKLIPIINTLYQNREYMIFSSINRKRRRTFRKFYYEFINSSKKFLYIATPYFVPPIKLIRLLKRKAEEGVDVRIITAGNTDVWLARQAGRFVYFTLLRSGVKVYEFVNRIFHAKQTLNENGVIIGSSNIDYRSFLHNLEIDIFIRDKKILNKTLQQWEKDLKESILIPYEEWHKRDLVEKFTEFFAYSLRYYL